MNNLSSMPQLNKVYQVDCLKFMKNIPDNSVDLIVADPPYNDLTMFGSSKKSKGKQVLGGHGWFENDQIPEDKFNLFFMEVLKELHRILKPNCHIYMFCNHKVLCRFKSMFVQYFTFANLLVWDKMIIGLGFSYRNQHELILLGSKGKNKIKVQNKGNVLRFKRSPNNYRKHPTQKPENIITELIQNSSSEGDVVFDPFGGSGTTFISALKLNRNFIGCELEPKYVQMANSRLAELETLEKVA